MFYVRLRERQENTTGRTPNKPLLKRASDENHKDNMEQLTR
jgi:hypothetical protein